MDDAWSYAHSHTAIFLTRYSVHAVARYLSQYEEKTTPQITAPRTLSHYRTRHTLKVAPVADLEPDHGAAVRPSGYRLGTTEQGATPRATTTHIHHVES